MGMDIVYLFRNEIVWIVEVLRYCLAFIRTYISMPQFRKQGTKCFYWPFFLIDSIVVTEAHIVEMYQVAMTMILKTDATMW